MTSIDLLSTYAHTECTAVFWRPIERPNRSFRTIGEAIEYLADCTDSETVAELHVHTAGGDEIIRDAPLSILIADARRRKGQSNLGQTPAAAAGKVERWTRRIRGFSLLLMRATRPSPHA